jgi:hypothetical protein
MCTRNWYIKDVVAIQQNAQNGKLYFSVHVSISSLLKLQCRYIFQLTAKKFVPALSRFVLRIILRLKEIFCILI